MDAGIGFRAMLINDPENTHSFVDRLQETHCIESGVPIIHISTSGQHLVSSQ